MSDFDTTVTVTISAEPANRVERVFKCGDTVGGYRLKKLIGQGGMGFVFLAEHMMMHRDYALKLVSGGQLSEAGLARFELEGKIIARLDHPNIVRVHNMGLDDGYPFYVMDLLSGRTLEDFIAPMPLASWLKIFCGIASGLAHAHARGVVHRDVKPSNVVLEGECPKLLDFGIAKVADKESARQFLTQQGDVIGSPLYMSPEQSLGLPIDQRTDIYSLGCTLFQCLTGRPPFKGETAMQTVMMHQHDSVPSIAQYARVENGSDVDALLERMLAKKPEQRYQNMQDVLHDLGRIERGLPVGARARRSVSTSDSADEEAETASEPPRPQARTGIIVALSISLLVLVSMPLIWFATRPTEKILPRPTRQEGLLDGRYDWGKDVRSLHDDGQSKDDAARAPRAVAAYKNARPIEVKSAAPEPDYFIQFPDWSLGLLSDGRHKPTDARGTVFIKDKSALLLSSGTGDARQVFNYPQIFDKVEKSAIYEFDLTGRYEVESAAEELLEPESRAVERILLPASRWTRLVRCHLQALPLNEAAIEHLGGMPALEFLSLRHIKFDHSIMAAQPLMQRLKAVELLESGVIDEVIQSLGRSRNLHALRIADCRVSQDSMRIIGLHPTLRYLHIRDKSLARMLPYLAQSTSLREIILSVIRLESEDIKSLLRLPALETLQLDANQYTDVERSKIKQFSGKIRFYDAQGTFPGN